MNYIKFRTQAAGDYVPEGVNLDNVILIKNGDPGNPRVLYIFPAEYDLDGDVNYYETAIRPFTVSGLPINTTAIAQVIRCINDNPNGAYLFCRAQQNKTGEPILWNPLSYAD